jgi:surfactin synthase thioesterase subunit
MNSQQVKHSAKDRDLLAFAKSKFLYDKKALIVQMPDRLHKPSEHPIKDYCDLMDKYVKYMYEHKHKK